MKKLYIIAGCNGAGKKRLLPILYYQTYWNVMNLSMQMKLLKGYPLSDLKEQEYKPAD